MLSPCTPRTRLGALFHSCPSATLRAIALTAALSAAACAASEDGGDYQSTVAPSGPPMLGVEMSPVPNSVQERENIDPNQGVYVQNTFPNTAAASMGVRPGDVILSINGSPIASMTDMRNEVGMNSVGDPVQVVVQRNGQQVAMGAPLQEWPSNIPRDRIDPESEKRFRQWQKERLDQQHKAVDALQEKLSALDRSIPMAPDAEAAKRAEALEKSLGAKPWQLSCAVVSSDDGAVVAVAERPAATTTAGEAPWRFAWSSDAKGGARP